MIWVKREGKKYSEDDDILTKLQRVRKIKNINEFIEPPMKFEHNPYELDNIDEAVQRIIKGIHTKENIKIMSDVDADGIVSCAIMYNYLKFQILKIFQLFIHKEVMVMDWKQF